MPLLPRRRFHIIVLASLSCTSSRTTSTTTIHYDFTPILNMPFLKLLLTQQSLLSWLMSDEWWGVWVSARPHCHWECRLQTEHSHSFPLLQSCHSWLQEPKPHPVVMTTDYTGIQIQLWLLAATYYTMAATRYWDLRNSSIGFSYDATVTVQLWCNSHLVSNVSIPIPPDPGFLSCCNLPPTQEPSTSYQIPSSHSQQAV